MKRFKLFGLVLTSFFCLPLYHFLEILFNFCMNIHTKYKKVFGILLVGLLIISLVQAVTLDKAERVSRGGFQR